MTADFGSITFESSQFRNECARTVWWIIGPFADIRKLYCLNSEHLSDKWIWELLMRFEKLDLNLLFVLDVLLSTRSVTRAAERLFLSQPASDSLATPPARVFRGRPPGARGQGACPDTVGYRTDQAGARRSPADPDDHTRATDLRPGHIDTALHHRVSSDYVISVLLAEVVEKRSETRAAHAI